MERREVALLVKGLIDSIEAARAVESPFYHLELDRVFPESVYEQMLAGMPAAGDYRRMSGRARICVRDDGTPTRVKIDLVPEYLRGLPAGKRALWEDVGRALCTRDIQACLVRRLAPPLQDRFGENVPDAPFYPVPILTRDVPGYRIDPHTDTHWKAITVQLYLPCDNAATHVGTVFHRVLPCGARERAAQMSFARNSGYAFAVGTNTWHSADPVGAEVTTRDSILLTYFVDSGAQRFLRNRGKRVGNFVLNELRHLARR